MTTATTKQADFYRVRELLDFGTQPVSVFDYETLQDALDHRWNAGTTDDGVACEIWVHFTDGSRVMF